MNSNQKSNSTIAWPMLAKLPAPAKVLVSAIIFTMTLAMLGALGQIIVHDIIPTFFEKPDRHSTRQTDEGRHSNEIEEDSTINKRGDLFSDVSIEKEAAVYEKNFYKTEQFVWTLKWTHIHLFGMNMIFIFLGAITLFLDLSVKLRLWLVALPFFGVIADIAAMWLKGFVSPVFFWLHVPGGGLFGIIFGFVSPRALWEMWAFPKER